MRCFVSYSLIRTGECEKERLETSEEPAISLCESLALWLYTDDIA